MKPDLVKRPTSWLSNLGRCPICHTRASSDLGCCKVCAECLFQPGRHAKGVYLGRYEGELKRAVRAMKFGKVTRLAELFADALAREMRTTKKKYDLICPVPLHWTRRLKRGYNQSVLIARPLAAKLGAAYARPLTRLRRTRQQARLSREERIHNVRTAFRSRAVTGLRVGLVDDVITTGATINACEEALLKAGAHSVTFISVTWHSGTLR